MASGIIRKQITSNGYALEVHWSSTPTISTNSSVVTAVVKLVCPYALWIGARSGNTITINGKAYTYNTSAISSDYGATHLLATITSDAISHSADGSKSVAISCSFKLNATLSETHYNTVTASDTVALDNIPRAATLLTAPNFSDSDNPTITYSNPAGTAVDNIIAAIYDGTENVCYVPYRSISPTGTSYTFELTSAERNALTGAITQGDSVSVRFYLATTIGGQTYYSSLTRTFSISGANPVVTGSIECDDGTYGLTGSRTTFLRYFSAVTARMDAVAQKGATIDESLCIIRNGSKSGYGNEYTFTYVDSNVFTFSAEDDRGNIGTDTVTASMIDYIIPTCTIGNSRPDALGNMVLTAVGDWYNGSFGSQSNEIIALYRYAINGGTFGDWTIMAMSSSGSRYSAYASFTITDFDQSAAYSFEVRVFDKVMEVSSTVSGLKSIPIYHWGENDFAFEVPVSIQGYGINDFVIATGTEAMGSNGTWYWRKWRSGRAECYGCRNYGNMSISTAWGNMYESAEFNQSLPTGLFAVAPEVVQINIIKSSGAAFVEQGYNNDITATTTGKFALCRPNVQNLSQVHLGFNVIGRWKL